MTEPARFGTIWTDRLLMRRWLESDREPFRRSQCRPGGDAVLSRNARPGRQRRVCRITATRRRQPRPRSGWLSAVPRLNQIWPMTAVLNEPSQAVMRRLGLTEVARFDHPRLQQGHPPQPHPPYHLARAAAVLTVGAPSQPCQGQSPAPDDAARYRARK